MTMEEGITCLDRFDHLYGPPKGMRHLAIQEKIEVRKACLLGAHIPLCRLHGRLYLES